MKLKLPLLIWYGFLFLIVMSGTSCWNEDAPAISSTQVPTIQSKFTVENSSLSFVLGSTDISVGQNRLVFGLIDREKGPLKGGLVTISTYRVIHEKPQGPIEELQATYHAWPAGAGGVYTIEPSFDTPGTWQLDVSVLSVDESLSLSSSRIKVAARSATPPLGTSVPRSTNKTIFDVDNLKELTSDRRPDRDLYQMSIAEALDTGKPLLITFSSPAFCLSSVCGPQLSIIKEIKDIHLNSVNFIHIEVYEHPHKIEGDLSKATVSPILIEWGLPSEPWTFIIDGEGILRAKFESFATREELEQALTVILH